MIRTPQQLREDAQRIWQAGVDGVAPARLLEAEVRVDGRWLWIGEGSIDLESVERIAVVGAGKAGAGMAAALEAILGPHLLGEKQVTGWVNVPADCVRPLSRIRLHAARPAGRNEPTAEGVLGSEAILRLVGSLGRRDLCLCLISGGGSALLPAPVEGISLLDKAAIARVLSAAGANIQELNAVRKPLSRIKGGGLLRACRAGRLVTLVISDVLGDPLDVIASGPTVPGESSPGAALAVLEKYSAAELGISAAVFEKLRRMEASGSGVRAEKSHLLPECQTIVLGNNAVAVDAAGMEAERLGYSHAMVSATELEGPVEEIGRRLARMARLMRDGGGPNCLIEGGEGTVRLAPQEERGLGGRNQQLALAALVELDRALAEGAAAGTPQSAFAPRAAADIMLLSAGTDGEDGPTDAAGAYVDAEVIASARRLGLDPEEFLRRNDAYHFFEPLGGLIKTGPTHTNVCDIRVVLVNARS